jgi:DNA-binding MarR family transcriptional regulator
MMAQHEVSDLEAHLGYWLRFVSNHVSYAFQRAIESQGVSVAEWVVLRALFDEDAATPSQLAERLGMTRGAISKLIDRLSAKLLALRTPSTRDRRSQTVALTPAGRELGPILAGLADENDRAFFATLSAEEHQALLRMMQSLVQTHGLKQVPIE